MSIQKDVAKRSRQPKREVWIGRVYGVMTQKNPWFGEDEGAYVNAVALARSKTDFEDRVTRSLRAQAFRAVEIETAEPARILLTRKSRLGSALKKLLPIAQQTGRVCYGPFHTYPRRA